MKYTIIFQVTRSEPTLCIGLPILCWRNRKRAITESTAENPILQPGHYTHATRKIEIYHLNALFIVTTHVIHPSKKRLRFITVRMFVICYSKSIFYKINVTQKRYSQQ